MGSGRFCLWIVAALVLAAQASDSVRAQAVTPAPLPGPESQALGLRAGGLIMYPSVETGVEATDNVIQANGGRRSDVGYFVAPAMRIESDWVRHSARLDVSSRHLYYFDNPSEDEVDFDLSAQTRVDVRRDTALEVEGGYFLEQEGRGDIDVPGAAAEPPNEHALEGSAKLIHTFGRLEASLEGAVEHRLFEDVDLIGGGTQNNTDRNYTEYEGALRLGYDLSPRLQPFVGGSYSMRRHTQDLDDNGLDRDSDGFAVEAGVEFELSPLLSGELALGYVRREFEDATLASVDGLTFAGNLIWRPSPITTVALTASTDVEETGVGTLSGSIERSIRISASHALRHNLTVAGGAEYAVEDFTGGDLREEIVLLAAGLTYQFNRAVALRFGYSFESFDSTSGRQFIENRVFAGLLVQR